MAYELPLPQKLRKQGWRVKISDKERLEPPHLTISCKTDRWRVGLRDRRFMDKVPDPDDVPKAVLDAITQAFDEACEAWNNMYPDNPVEEGDDNG